MSRNKQRNTSNQLLKLSLLIAYIRFAESFQPCRLFALRSEIGNSPHKPKRIGLLLLLAEANTSSNEKKPPNNGRRKKKKKIVINTNLLGVENVSSDGNLTEQKEKQKEAQKSRDAVTSNLGKPSKKKKKKTTDAGGNNKKLSKKAQKLADQRTAMGSVDGTLQAGLAAPEDQHIQIQEVKRGTKQVTIVRGFTCAMDERKKILKELKKKIGGGGALIDGIIELQGCHSDVVTKNLKSKGFTQIMKQ